MIGRPSIGRDCQLVLLWAGSRIDLRDVTGFQSRPIVNKIRVHPLNSDPTEIVSPAGWEGKFEIDRGNSEIDQLFNDIEQGFRSGGSAPWFSAGISNAGTTAAGTIYQYLAEPNGSTSTYEFSGCSITLDDAGTWRSSAITKQAIGFFASVRNIL